MIYWILASLAIFEIQAQFIIDPYKFVSSSACTTLVEDYDSSGVQLQSFADSSQTLVATRFTATATSSRCKMQVGLKKNNTPTGVITVDIYSSVGDAPGVLLATSSTTISCASLTDSFAFYEVEIAANLTSATNYWVVLRKSTAVNATHYVFWQGQSSGGRTMTSNGVSWSFFAAYRLNLKLYQ